MKSYNEYWVYPNPERTNGRQLPPTKMYRSQKRAIAFALTGDYIVIVRHINHYSVEEHHENIHH